MSEESERMPVETWRFSMNYQTDALLEEMRQGPDRDLIRVNRLIQNIEYLVSAIVSDRVNLDEAENNQS